MMQKEILNKVDSDLGAHDLEKKFEFNQTSNKDQSQTNFTQEFSQEQSQPESELQSNEPFQEPRVFVESLSKQMIEYAQECQKNHEFSKNQLYKFLEVFAPIAEGLSLCIQICGSFATKLWLKHCDIDLLLFPVGEPIYWSAQPYLDHIYFQLKKLHSTTLQLSLKMLKHLRIPMIRIEMKENNGKQHKAMRKFDITLMDRYHDGQRHVTYITKLISYYPHLQPIFYVLKQLSKTFNLNDPKNKGITSLTLIFMIARYLQQEQLQFNQNSALGEKLLGFLKKYGELQGYQMKINQNGDHKVILNIFDPTNTRNNLGGQTDAQSLQVMFRTAYLMLHTKNCDSKLSYLFGAKNIFTF